MKLRPSVILIFVMIFLCSSSTSWALWDSGCIEAVKKIVRSIMVKPISKELLPKIFEQDSTKNHIDDEKLSLYLCRGLIEGHGGNISAKNNVTQGCTFTITLPIK